jgi:RNA polymerase sigma-70 factor, ECF subfamily
LSGNLESVFSKSFVNTTDKFRPLNRQSAGVQPNGLPAGQLTTSTRASAVLIRQQDVWQRMPEGLHHEMLSVASDEAVMAVVCARDDDVAFSELVRRWRKRLHLTCFRLTGNRDDADDAVQEAFVKAFLARSQFRGQATFATWFWRIAVNVAHDVRRRRSPHVELLEAHSVVGDSDPVEAVITTERRESVLEALRQLTDTQRTVVVLRHYEQMKFREIAEVLDVPTGTVASRMAEALNRLSQLLDSEWNGE